MCAYLKVVALHTGRQSNYINYCWFLCDWDSRAKNQHKLFENDRYEQTLSLLKNFLNKLLSQQNITFMYSLLHETCILVGPQTRKTVKEYNFETTLSREENKVWLSAKMHVATSWVTTNSRTTTDLVEEFIQSYKVLGGNHFSWIFSNAIGILPWKFSNRCRRTRWKISKANGEVV